MKALLVVLSLSLFAGCSYQRQTVEAQADAVVVQKEENAPAVSSENIKDDKLRAEYVIPERKISKGVLALNDDWKNQKDFIRFYNEDGSLWYKFTFYYDDRDGKFDYENDNFRPDSFHPDYFLLVLSYAGEDRTRYKVVVNEETNLIKYVKKSDDALIYVPWEKHALETFSVDFNKDTNPVREAPGGKLRESDPPAKGSHIDSLEIRGDWMKIEWYDKTDSDGKPIILGSGWIRWRKDGKLIIELNYLC